MYPNFLLKKKKKKSGTLLRNGSCKICYLSHAVATPDRSLSNLLSILLAQKGGEKKNTDFFRM